jgi:hypothetical protein
MSVLPLQIVVEIVYDTCHWGQAETFFSHPLQCPNPAEVKYKCLLEGEREPVEEYIWRARL